ENVNMWLELLDRHIKEEDGVSRLLVGNKADLEGKRAVAYETAATFAREAGIPFLETSALNAANVEKAFFTMAGEIKNRIGELKTEDEEGIIRLGGSTAVLEDNANACSGWCSYF